MKIYIKKEKNWRNIFFLIILTIAIIGVLNFFSSNVRNFFYLISAPIQRTLWIAGHKTFDFIEIIREIKELKKENKELKSEIESLLTENAFLKELKKENEFLKPKKTRKIGKKVKTNLKNLFISRKNDFKKKEFLFPPLSFLH